MSMTAAGSLVAIVSAWARALTWASSSAGSSMSGMGRTTSQIKAIREKFGPHAGVPWSQRTIIRSDRKAQVTRRHLRAGDPFDEVSGALIGGGSHEHPGAVGGLGCGGQVTQSGFEPLLPQQCAQLEERLAPSGALRA